MLPYIFTFLFGTMLGSFLNVVIWRLPLGMSLSFPGSHCPKCKHPIRPWHNIPVLGWLILRGRCRDCREPISPRYPIVEFLVGVGVLILVFPFIPLFYDGPLLELGLKVVTETAVFLTLFAAGLILWDGNRIPLRLFLPVIVLWLYCTRNDLILAWVAPALSVLLALIPKNWGRKAAIPVLILTVIWVLRSFFCFF